MMNPAEFGRRVLEWFDAHGRKQLPWKEDPTPYRVWVSEIMLQQTQVATVIPYYQRFMARFPDIGTLAAAEPDEILRFWAGLGYYARARHLHQTARILCDRHDGELPLDSATLQELPGIGRSTAGAILALAAGQRQAILDGNVKRLLARFAAIEGWPGQSRVLATLWDLAERHTPTRAGGRLYPSDDGSWRDGLHAAPAALRNVSAGGSLRRAPTRTRGGASGLQAATGLAGTNHSDAVAAHDGWRSAAGTPATGGNLGRVVELSRMCVGE
jgi:endonuclease III